MLINRCFLSVNHTGHWWVPSLGMAFDDHGPFLHIFSKTKFLSVRADLSFQIGQKMFGVKFGKLNNKVWWRWILFWVKIIRFRAMYIYIVAIFCVKMGKIRKYIYSCMYIKKLERMQKNRVYLWWGVQEDTGQVEWRQVGMGYFHWLYPCVYFLFLNDVSIENAYWKNCNTFFKVRCFYDTMRLFCCWGFRARK